MNWSRFLFNASAGLEGLTGLAALITPIIVIDLLFASEIDALGLYLARVLGIALGAFGIATWEWSNQPARLNARVGLCLYNLGVGLLLAYFGFVSNGFGILLWPVALLHLVLGLIMFPIILNTVRKSAAGHGEDL
jgi:peptidoglycan/LPS O-acetylase OafA/YrhL